MLIVKKKFVNKNIKFKFVLFLINKYLKVSFITRYIYFYKLINKCNFNNLLFELNLFKLIIFFCTLFEFLKKVLLFIYNFLFLFNINDKNKKIFILYCNFFNEIKFFNTNFLKSFKPFYTNTKKSKLFKFFFRFFLRS